jgi:FdhD protein
MARIPGDDRTGGCDPPVLRYDGRRLVRATHAPADELSVAVSVNGAPVARLLASPHDLHYLVVGFLRAHGAIRVPSDLLSLSVCEESGTVAVRVRGELPAARALTFSSGGGETLRATAGGEPPGATRSVSGVRFRPETLFGAMGLLTRAAERYRRSGGIHAAGVGDGERLILFAEDVSRHNAVDRVAGEALLKGIDLSDRLLATSGRVSSAMAAKAAGLGIAAIVSRTSPTDGAVRICIERGITLVGYVRRQRFNVYAHPERIFTAGTAGKILGVTGAILSGGRSQRMGSDKALLPYRGGRFIEAIYRGMAELFDDVIVACPAPEAYAFLPGRRVPDLFPGVGALAGIHSALSHSMTDRVFVVGCDMPHLNGELVRHLCSVGDDVDVVVPEGGNGPEPLHAVYRKTALPAIEAALRSGERELVSFYGNVRVRRVPRETVERIDPGLSAFRNINTAEDYYRLREGG